MLSYIIKSNIVSKDIIKGLDLHFQITIKCPLIKKLLNFFYR